MVTHLAINSSDFISSRSSPKTSISLELSVSKVHWSHGFSIHFDGVDYLWFLKPGIYIKSKLEQSTNIRSFKIFSRLPFVEMF